ncbi:hypothetical protein [Enterococcus mundtii]|nr:hypothetical protein [Enterococcus mundtii]NAA58353.1 hypothetical protein [Enterococcus mundtii]NAA90181.1 hypothetical protein [Enterococcus mundtii]
MVDRHVNLSLSQLLIIGTFIRQTAFSYPWQIDECSLAVSTNKPVH